jgi:hypothetical protein
VFIQKIAVSSLGATITGRRDEGNAQLRARSPCFAGKRLAETKEGVAERHIFPFGQAVVNCDSDRETFAKTKQFTKKAIWT